MARQQQAKDSLASAKHVRDVILAHLINIVGDGKFAGHKAKPLVASHFCTSQSAYWHRCVNSNATEIFATMTKTSNSELAMNSNPSHSPSGADTGDYLAWLTRKIQAAIDDPEPLIDHDVVMAEMDAILAEPNKQIA